MASDLLSQRKIQTVTDLSEQGKLVNRTILLTAVQLEVRDSNGTLLMAAERQELSGATVVETGTGAYMELGLLRGVSKRIAFCPLSGMKELYRCREMINDWCNEASKALTRRASADEESLSDREKSTKPLTWRQRISIILRLAHYAFPYRKQIILSSIVLLMTVGLQILPPYLFKQIIDGAVMSSSVSKFAGLIGLLLCVYVFQAIFQVIRASIGIRIGSMIMSHIRKDMFDKLISLSIRFYERRKTANFISRIKHDANGIQGLLTEGVTRILVQLLMAASVLVIMFLLNWQISLLIVAVLIISSTLMWRVFPAMRSLMNRKWNADYWLQQYISETLHGMRVVKAFHREENEKVLFQEFNSASVRRMVDQQRFTLWLSPSIHLAISAGIAMVWFVGGRQVMNGSMSLGTVIAFTSYLSMFLEQLRGNFRVTKAFNSSMASADRILELLHTPTEVNESKEPVSLPFIRGDIRVKSLSFGYEKGLNVLKDISMHVRAGEKVGIIGRSGAGKTTLIHLLCRFYDPDEGSIEIDGIDLRHIAIADLRRQVGIVFQETYLFDGTIADNIAYGCPDAAPEQIIQAARQANAHAFISRLPFGYDTSVGERGVHLSGGEKQRISIARTLLQNPSILILDEATSSVDLETEREIQEALDRLCKGRTTIAIAHRLNTLSNADRIIELDHGRIADSGKQIKVMKEGVR
ncbi:ABC transporter ATP-binding protein [Cohnella sp.]|uniref:ABC transporter ATP-binding protein n=1 Tax=Cohnella sp. TaxID=1883426 RepID=UPI0035674C01